MKRSLTMPLFLAPGLDWFKLVNNIDNVLLAREARYDGDKRYNRILFAGTQGKQSFSIPLVGESKKSTVGAIRISYLEKWQHQLVQALRTAYGKSPFYEYYDYKLEPILLKEHEYLADLNQEIIGFMLEAFKLNIALGNTSATPGNPMDSAFLEEYYQVFAEKNGFIPGLSALDYLFNEGWECNW